MITIKGLIDNIPDGKKREYLGQLFVNALIKYYASSPKEVDLNELILRSFNDLIQNNNFVKDLIKFSDEELSKILNVESCTGIGVGQIRASLIKYYDIQYDISVPEDTKIDTLTQCEQPLHGFQERIRRKVINLIFNGNKRFLIHMPTGSGKTRTAAEIISDFIRLSSSRALLNDKIKILWIAQSVELCQQAAETVKKILDKKSTIPIHIGHFYDKEELPHDIENNSAIIFCGIQKLLKHYQDPVWQRIKNENYLVIVDEAHRSVAKQWIKALDFFVSDNSVYLLGLTATPGIGTDDGSYSLASYYNGNKISITDKDYSNIENPIQYLVEKKFLAKINRIDIDSNFPIDDISVNEGEFLFAKTTLDRLAVSETRNASIINIIKENFAKNKKILVFTCGLEHNKILQNILLNYNIVSETVDQSTQNRASIIERFKNGNLNILFNYGVLTTGFDAPKTDVCIIARPISSIVMYSQMVGRILRGEKNQGNIENTLYTIKDNWQHGDYDTLFNSFNDFYK